MRRHVGLNRNDADRGAYAHGAEADRAHRHVHTQVLVGSDLDAAARAGGNVRARIDGGRGAVNRTVGRRQFGRDVTRRRLVGAERRRAAVGDRCQPLVAALVGPAVIDVVADRTDLAANHVGGAFALAFGVVIGGVLPPALLIALERIG